MEDELKYPIGKYDPRPYDPDLKNDLLRELSFLPSDLEMAILNLDEAQLNTPYRAGGWTVQQLVHHIADSHVNAYIRCKLALTEDRPLIKPYDENAWSLLNDVLTVPINVSLTLLHALHLRWVACLKGLSEEEWMRKMIHPEQNKEMTLFYLLGLYVWHGKHHVRHITALRERMDW